MTFQWVEFNTIPNKGNKENKKIKNVYLVKERKL